MTRNSLLLTVGTVLVAGNPALVAPAVKNLAPNPSFEGQGGWSFWAWAPEGIKPTSSPAWDTEVARTGRRSIRTRCPGGRHTGVWDNEHAGALIPVDGEKVYRCEVWIKSQVPEGKTLTARFTVGFRDAGKKPLGVGAEALTRTFTGATEWTPVGLRVPAPAGARFARVDLLASGAGTAWFDDVLMVASEAASEALSDRGPSVVWARTSVAPNLDGKLDDRCWRRAALLTDFTKVGGREFPRNPTRAYLLYDETALYIGVRCREWALDPAQQLRHTFRASQKDRDGNVFADDCVEVFVDPKGDGQYYQFAFNSLGVRYDGSGLDRAWNGQWQVAAAVGEQAWTAELAIPFSDLGVTPGKQMRFRFNICRQEKPNQEDSTWAPVHEGFHEPLSFAAGTLGEHVVQVEPHDLPQLMQGAGEQSAALTVRNASDTDVRTGLYLKVVPSSGPAGHASTSHPAPARSEETVRLPFVQEEGRAFRVSLSVVDETADSLLLRTPAYHLTSCELPRGVLGEALRGTSTAWVNGELISNGTFVLRRGTNLIALQCHRGADARGVAGSLRILPDALVADQEIPLDDCWKVAAPPTREDWHSPGFDDSGWAYATRLPDGSVWAGNSTSPAICLRRVLVVQHSRFQGIDTTDGLHIARGTHQHISLGVASPVSSAMQDLVVEVSSPADLRLVGVDDTVGQCAAPLHLKQATTRSADGTSEATTAFRFENTPPVDKSGRVPRLGLVFGLAQRSTAKRSEVRYRCRGVAGDRNVTELWNRLPVVCLPPLANKRPSRILLQIFHSWFMPCSKPQMAALVDTWWRAGFNSHGNSTSKYTGGKPCPWLEAARAKGMTIYVEGPHPSFFTSILKEHPEARMVNFDGPSNNLHFAVAPIFIVEQGRAQFRREITQFIRRTGAAGFHWDLEHGPFTLCDVSPRSLEKFAARAKLDHVPTKDEVQQRYRTQWIDFMCWLWAEVGKVMREGIKEADPEAFFSVYSGYQSAYTKDRYGMDWKYFRGVVDLGAMGYGRQPMEETFQALPGTPLQLGVLCYYLSPPGTCKSLKNSLLRRISDGGRSVLLFEWSVLDGRAYHKISQAAAVLADFEAFFLRNEKLDLYQTDGDISREDVVMLAGGDAFLLLVFNDDPGRQKRGTVVLQNTPTGLVISDHPAGTALGDAASPLTVDLPPNDVAVFRVAPGR